MKGILLLLASSLTIVACDAVNSVKDANKNTEEANEKIDKMLEETRKLTDGIHLQELAEAKKELFSKENTLVPDNPAKMIPAGKIFGEKATAKELAQFVEVTLADINKNKPGDFNRVDGKIPPELKRELEHNKIAMLTGLQVVMGFASQEKIEEMVQTQILNQGRYERAALSGLMLRALFIKSYRYGSALHDPKIKNISELSEAVELVEHLEYIVRLPFASEIQVHAKMLDRANNVDVVLDPRMTATIWDEIATDITERILPRLDKEKKALPAALAALHSKVGFYQDYWKSLPIPRR